MLLNPISGRGGGLFRTPLEISGSYRSIFKIQTAFVSPQHDLHFYKKKFQKFVKGGIKGKKNHEFQVLF